METSLQNMTFQLLTFLKMLRRSWLHLWISTHNWAVKLMVAIHYQGLQQDIEPLEPFPLTESESE